MARQVLTVGMSKKTILVVDDEPKFRFSLGLILKNQGFNVIEAKDGVEALRFFSEASGQRPGVDLIITDIKMPGMDGLELLENIIRRKEKVRTLVMTGYGDRETTLKLQGMGIYGIIHKPFDAEHLMEMIASTLGGKAA